MTTSCLQSFFCLCAIVAVFVSPQLFAQTSAKEPSKTIVQTSTQATAKVETKPDPLAQMLPTDPSIKIGTLANGLRYYIRANKKPEKRAEMRLVVNAGSMQEDDDQQGLAHFAEHMAFNGTKNFAKQDLVNYLERIGLRFGPDLNAYTSFDETVYMLQVPTDSAAIMTKALQILEDWAHNISFDGVEIDKERGVVTEEWRLGRGAMMRTINRQLPIAYKGSRYAERLPIGQKAILDTFKHETLRRFYREWYRPNLMAVVIVGDIDVAVMEERVKAQFSGLTNPANPRPRTVASVPDHKDTYVSTVSDAETPVSVVQIFSKTDKPSRGSAGDYRRNIVQAIAYGIISERLGEIAQKPNPPFGGAYCGATGPLPLRTKDANGLMAYFIKDNNIPRALETILTEGERARRHGFTLGELDRMKISMLRRMEKGYLEREKTESEGLASEYIRNFLEQETIPGIEVEFMLYKAFLPTITLEEVNTVAKALLPDSNRVILASLPQKDGAAMPEPAQLLALVESIKQKTIEPYKETVSVEPLIEPGKEPKASQILAEKPVKGADATEITFANGVKAVLKYTEFKNDEISIQSFSPGGHSLVATEDFPSAANITGIMQQSGVGAFDAIALQKKLAGKVVAVTPYVNELYEGVNASCSPKDVETALQLIYLSFTAPRKDSAGFQSYRQRLQAVLENLSRSPEYTFQDTVQQTLSGYHPRRPSFTKDFLDKVSLDKAYSIYQNRFADASDFTFFVVGKYDTATLKPLLAKYLGGLPSIKRKENWRDVGVKPPKGLIEKTIKKGVEPKSLVNISFDGDFVWNDDNRFALSTLMETLNIKLREVMREDKGGVYGVSASASPSRIPKQRYSIQVEFGCAPDRVDELVKTVYAQIDSVKLVGLGKDYVNKVKETRRRQHETNLKENSYWMGALQNLYMNGDPVEKQLNVVKASEKLTPALIKQSAQKYFGTKNRVKVVLVPEKIVNTDAPPAKTETPQKPQ
jgi:zinc protease